MKQHTTNDINIFIEVSEDCPVQTAEVPPLKDPKSIARLEYELLANAPYQFTSDDAIYETRGKPKGISREAFFSKGQPCFRASALPKRYGWGIHSNGEGKIALYAMESEAYHRFLSDESVRHLRAMRNCKE